MGIAAREEQSVDTKTMNAVEGDRVPFYIVERHLPGITVRQLAALQRRVRDQSAELTAQGRPVRYSECLFVPSESRCLCVFDAADAALVREVNDDAQIPYSRILCALEFKQ
jgi:hypothetical protein